MAVQLIMSLFMVAAALIATTLFTPTSLLTFANAEESPFQGYAHIRCEACKAISEEIGNRMNETNKVRTSVQTSHRLEGDNERRIDYESSELRAVEILDGICNVFFNLYFLRWDNVTEKRYFGKDKSVKRAPFYGKNDKAILGAPSRKLMQFCQNMMEENDAVVTRAIMKDRTLDDLTDTVCHKKLKHCSNTKAIEKSLAKEAKYKAAHHKYKEKKRIKKERAERKRLEEEEAAKAKAEAAEAAAAAAAASGEEAGLVEEPAATAAPAAAEEATAEL